jgi:hypothetical protein
MRSSRVRKPLTFRALPAGSAAEIKDLRLFVSRDFCREADMGAAAAHRNPPGPRRADESIDRQICEPTELRAKIPRPPRRVNPVSGFLYWELHKLHKPLSRIGFVTLYNNGHKAVCGTRALPRTLTPPVRRRRLPGGKTGRPLRTWPGPTRERGENACGGEFLSDHLLRTLM